LMVKKGTGKTEVSSTWEREKKADGKKGEKKKLSLTEIEKFRFTNKHVRRRKRYKNDFAKKRGATSSKNLGGGEGKGGRESRANFPSVQTCEKNAGLTPIKKLGKKTSDLRRRVKGGGRAKKRRGKKRFGAGKENGGN